METTGRKAKDISSLTPSELVDVTYALAETERIRKNLLKVAGIMGLGEELIEELKTSTGKISN